MLDALVGLSILHHIPGPADTRRWNRQFPDSGPVLLQKHEILQNCALTQKMCINRLPVIESSNAATAVMTKNLTRDATMTLVRVDQPQAWRYKVREQLWVHSPPYARDKCIVFLDLCLEIVSKPGSKSKWWNYNKHTRLISTWFFYQPNRALTSFFKDSMLA